MDIEELTSSEIIRSIREGLALVGVCWNAADLEGLQTLPYRCDTLAVAVPAGHPLALRDSCSFSETLDCEHVGLPASTAVYTMLARAAAIIGRPLNYRAVVSSFDATIRCVRAAWRGHHAQGDPGHGGPQSGCAGRAGCAHGAAHRCLGAAAVRHLLQGRQPAMPAARTLVDYLAGCAQAG